MRRVEYRSIYNKPVVKVSPQAQVNAICRAAHNSNYPDPTGAFYALLAARIEQVEDEIQRLREYEVAAAEGGS